MKSKSRPGVQYVCESYPGDRLMLCNNEILIVNPDRPIRKVVDGLLYIADFSKDEVEWIRSFL